MSKQIARQVVGYGIMGAGAIGANLMPAKSIYNSIHEDRSFGSSVAHFGGSVLAGTAIGGAALLGGGMISGAFNYSDIASNIAKGF